MSTEIDRSITAMDAASEMLEKLAAKLAELSPHKGNDLPEDAQRLLVRQVEYPAKQPEWFDVYRIAGYWYLNNGFRVDLSRVTHWMRVPEVET